jgi:hypothetical protein
MEVPIANAQPVTDWGFRLSLHLRTIIQIKFQFSENQNEKKPDGWIFSEDKMPAIGSKWIIFIQDASSLPLGGFNTLRGRYGRQEATEKNLDEIHKAAESFLGQR